MNSNQRITLEDNLVSAMTKLAEGNPGAITAMGEMMKIYGKVDPQSSFGPLSPLLSLDSHGIYGSEIWLLWKDVCDFEVRKVALLFRACQFGFRTYEWLSAHVKEETRQTNPIITDNEWLEIDEFVCAELSEFQKAA